MSGRGGKRSKVKVHGAKPELPPFLQAMKQQIVANEDAERKERSLRKRKEMSKSGASSRGGGVDSDDNEPSVVKLNDNDLTEEEYKKMKRDLETQYKLDQDACSQAERVELDIDKMIEQRSSLGSDIGDSEARGRPTTSSSSSSRPTAPGQSRARKGDARSSTSKKLSYSSSSSSEADG